MKRIGLPLAATLLTAGLTLSACGGGTPSKDDLAEQLSGGDVGLTDEQADCVADELLDSKLSDDQLNAIADDDKSDLSSDEEAEALEVISEAAVTCATK